MEQRHSTQKEQRESACSSQPAVGRLASFPPGSMENVGNGQSPQNGVLSGGAQLVMD